MLGPGSGRFWVLLTTLQACYHSLPRLHLSLSPEKLGSVAKDLEWQAWGSTPGATSRASRPVLCLVGQTDGGWTGGSAV